MIVRSKSESWKGFLETQLSQNVWGLPYRIMSGKTKVRGRSLHFRWPPTLLPLERGTLRSSWSPACYQIMTLRSTQTDRQR